MTNFSSIASPGRRWKEFLSRAPFVQRGVAMSARDAFASVRNRWLGTMFAGCWHIFPAVPAAAAPPPNSILISSFPACLNSPARCSGGRSGRMRTNARPVLENARPTHGEPGSAELQHIYDYAEHAGLDMQRFDTEMDDEVHYLRSIRKWPRDLVTASYVRRPFWWMVFFSTAPAVCERCMKRQKRRAPRAQWRTRSSVDYFASNARCPTARIGRP